MRQNQLFNQQRVNKKGFKNKNFIQYKMIKRTVGLRPIKYSKLPSDAVIGLFNASEYERQALNDAFSKLDISPRFINEKTIWEGKHDVSEIDFVLLFSHIPYNELKNIWLFTGCDQVMKFASFNRIYNQCVYGKDFLWINCDDVEKIEQKIRWDKINYSTEKSKKNLPQESLSQTTTVRVKTPQEETPQEETQQEETTISPLTTTTVEETESNLVTVTDIIDDEKRSWTMSLPKKVVVLCESEEDSLSENDESQNNGTCSIL